MNKNNNTIIEKGERISDLVNDIKSLDFITKVLNCDIDIAIGTNTSGNIMKYSIFRDVVYKHINKIKEEIPNIIDELKKELNTLIK